MGSFTLPKGMPITHASDTTMPKDHMPCTSQSPRFDAGQWLIWAERLGYRIYLSEPGPGGRLGLVTEVRTRPRGAEHVDLWRAFQGQASTRKINRAALIKHLLNIGRVVRHTASANTVPTAAVPPDHCVND